MNKKLLCILVSIMMLGTMIAVPAFATQEEGTVESSETQAKALGVEDFTIVVGATNKLEPKVEGANEGDYTFSYESDKTSVAEVNKDGTVTAKAEGDAVITITATEKQDAADNTTDTDKGNSEGTTEESADNPAQNLGQEGEAAETPSTTPSEEPKTITKEVKVTVLDSVEITCADLTIEEDDTDVLKPIVEEKNYTFSYKIVSGDDVIALKADGTVEGLKPGEAVVAISVEGIIGANKNVNITVEAGNYDGYVFEIPEPMPAEFSTSDFRGKNKTIAYKYTDPETNEEKITFKMSEVTDAFGEADLTEKFMTGEIQVWEVYKYKKKTKNLMNLEDMTITYGDDVNLKDKALNKDAEFTFTSSDDRVVDVDSEGNIKTVASGEAEITVTCPETKYYREQTKTIKITVNKADQTIEGDSSVTKYVGEGSFNINASAKTTLIYNSSNSKVATVDKFTGKVTIKDAGTAVIMIDTTGDSRYNAASRSVKLTVKKPYATTLSVKALSGKDKKKIRLTWKPVRGASKYQIYVYNTKKTVTVKTSSLVGSHQDSNGNFYFTHTKLKAGKTYKYKVRAISYNSSGKAYYGPYSSAKSAKAKSR
ncbi:MAG: Ig-like domain-containing protein [Lentihominibacter sp.]